MDWILLNMLLPDVVHILLLLLIHGLLVLVPLRDVEISVRIDVDIEIQIQIDLWVDSRDANHSGGRKGVLRRRDDETSVLDIIVIMLLRVDSMLEGVLVVRVVIVIVRVFAHTRRDGQTQGEVAGWDGVVERCRRRGE